MKAQRPVDLYLKKKIGGGGRYDGQGNRGVQKKKKKPGDGPPPG